MQRYTIICGHCDTDFGLVYLKKEHGEWISWKDHNQEIKRITEIHENQINGLKEGIRLAKSQEDREMKRYTLHERVLDREDETITGNFKGQMFEDPSGEWVRWEDVKDVVNELWLKNVNLMRDNIGVNFIKCNCEEMINGRVGASVTEMETPKWWICPAHGYKRR